VFKPKTLPQPELFVPSIRLVQPATSSFYTKLDQTLASFQFGDQARQICAPAYSDSKRGRPGVDPVVYFKMLMIGFFENISSERGIAERCRDSISIRFFLGYDLTQSTPDHSTYLDCDLRPAPGAKLQAMRVAAAAPDSHVWKR